MKKDYARYTAGSFYSIGRDENPELRIIFMHGATSNAGRYEKEAHVLSEALPSAKIIVPNAPYHMKPADNLFDRAKANIQGPGFVWYPPNGDEPDILNDSFADLIYDAQDEDPNAPLILFGVSQGGFRASGHFMISPHEYAGLILHGAGLLDGKLREEEGIYESRGVLPPYAEKLNPDSPRVFTMVGAFEWAGMRHWKYLKGPEGWINLHRHNEMVLQKNGIKTQIDFKIMREHNPHETSAREVAAYIHHLMPGLEKSD